MWTPIPTMNNVAPSECEGDDVQRDMDLVRSILLRIDEALRPLEMTDLLEPGTSEDERAKLDYHLRMLVTQTGLLSGDDVRTYDGPDWIELNLTWAGHEFLDNVRDPEIWRQTKAGAAKAGQWSLKTLADIAVSIGKARIEHLFATGQIGG